MRTARISMVMLARENGKGNTAEVLRAWLENKDRDLRERGGGGVWVGVGDESGNGEVTNGHGEDRKASCAGPLNTLERTQLHVKQSIDHALNILKAHPHSYPHSCTLADTKPQ